MNLNILSDADVALVSEVIGTILKTRKNTTSQGKGNLQNSNFIPAGSYIALPSDVDGIPGLMPAESEPDPHDIPGKALCDIYKVDTATGEMAAISKSVVVYNMSQSDIGTEWLIVNRTPFGEWVFSPPGGAGQRILFEIIEADFACCEHVQVEVIGGPCGGSPKTGDLLYVWDEAKCVFALPEEEFVELVGKRGYATKLEFGPDPTGTGTGSAGLCVPVVGTGTGTGTGSGGCQVKTDCRWSVDFLCCGALI